MSHLENHTNSSGVQTFTAPDLRTAMNEVRRTLGADALILDHTQVGDRIVLRACLEEHYIASQMAHKVQPQTAPTQAPVANANSIHSDKADAAEPTSAGARPGSFSSQMPVEQPAATSSGQSILMSDITVPEAQPKPHPQSQREMSYAHSPGWLHGGAYRFIGLSGAGKTTLLIKLMVEWVKQRGPTNIRVFSHDSTKLAGQEALQLACTMLNVKMNTESLPCQHLRRAPGELLLIDTPALDSGLAYEPSGPHVKDIFVCSALHRLAAISGATPSPAAWWASCAGVSLSHLDVTLPADDLLEFVQRRGLPLYWLGSSRGLDNGLQFASKQSFNELWSAPLSALEVSAKREHTQTPVNNLTHEPTQARSAHVFQLV